ncbi:ABC transporter ATP-binding protein [Paenibacillus sp. CAU 1782]
MSKQFALEINSVSKKYKVYKKPYHRLMELFNLGSSYQEVEALRGISFKVEKGQTYGIVGPNGSGKSTLLQIVTGILQPTEGNVRVSGRISALLELGAGFNMEYTGRENIFLYASILGVEKKEIEEKLDEIINFAQIGDFIDRPVKTYSSGMYVRLAFAVAINVEPEILIVDEALAVGDESFQRKCFRKFEELKEKGVTILLVTHSLGLVKLFCDKAVLIYKGKLIEQGHPNHVINVYTKLVSEIENGNSEPSDELQEKTIIVQENELNEKVKYESDEFRYGNKDGEIIDFRVYGENDNYSNIFKHGEKIHILIKLKYNTFVSSSLAAYTVKTISGVEVTGTNTDFEQLKLTNYKEGELVEVLFVQNVALNAGDYVISLGLIELAEEKIIVMDRRYDVTTFKVIESKKATGLVDPNADVFINKINFKDE